MEFVARVAILCSLVLMTGCVRHPSLLEEVNEPSAIGQCGGGIKSGATAGIEAEYKKLELAGGIDANFERYVKSVLDANGVSDEKYNSYIACILIIDERRRSEKASMLQREMCTGACNNDKNSCDAESRQYFDLCIKDEMEGCYDDCRSHGISHNRCLGQHCAWTELPQWAKDFHINRCNRTDAYQEQITGCVVTNNTCRNEC